jgi:predicted nucleic acid-binding protein
MAAYYADGSALAKRYVREAGSAWMIALTSPAAANRIYTALVTGAEFVAALARRVRMGSITAADGEAAIAAFRTEFHDLYGIVPVTYDILERAMDLAEPHGLRGYDAIQLACALATRDELAASGVPSLTFLSADAGLNAAAAAEGLPVQDPTAHR